MTKGGNIMNMTLTTINHSLSVTNDAGESVRLSIVYDVTDAPESAIKQWIAADRTIAFQRTLKKLSMDEIKAFNGKTIVYDGSRSKVNIDPETAMIAKLRSMSADEQKYIIAEMMKKVQK